MRPSKKTVFLSILFGAFFLTVEGGAINVVGTDTLTIAGGKVVYDGYTYYRQILPNK